MSSLVAGAEIITFFTPSERWLDACSASVKKPVDSMTISTPASSHGILAGSRSEKTVIVSPLMTKEPSSISTSPSYLP